MQALFLSHHGMTEALGQTQVLPYLRGLATAGIGIDLLACEPPLCSPLHTAGLREELAGSGIRYTPLVRRPGRGLSDKARDCAGLFATALRRIRENGQDRAMPLVIHARSQLPAAVAEALCRVLPGARLLFDCRGLLAEEYVALGHWREGDLRCRLTRRMERSFFQSAHRVVVLTEALREALCGRGGVLEGQGDRVMVIPCCVDTERFRPDPEARARGRRALGIGEAEVLLCFPGSLHRYDLPAMVRLFLALRRRRDARLLLLTRDDPGVIRTALCAAGCGESLHVVSAPPHKVPEWLAAADLGMALLKQDRTAIAASPTKVAECLAAGLPTTVTAGIGDNERLLGPGLLSAALDEASLDDLAGRLLHLLADPAAARDAARQTALRHFSLSAIGVPRYRAVYQQLEHLS